MGPELRMTAVHLEIDGLVFFVSEVGAFASLAAALEALELSTQRKA